MDKQGTSMNLSELGKAVSKYAPLLGAVLPIPGVAAIGSAIAAAFGGDINDTEDLINRINTDPDSQVKLAEIQANKQIELERIAAERLNSEHEYSYKNTDSARRREVDLAKAGYRDYMQMIISILVILGFFASFYVVLKVKQDDGDNQIIYMMLGILSTAFGAVVNYYLGSSLSSQKKDIVLASPK